MNYWRMSFRCGIRGFEMFEYCINEKVAAITYFPLDQTDLSQYSYLEPRDLWKQLKPTQQKSLKRFAYEIKKGDIIYVKQGVHIVGRGIVNGKYLFTRETSIIDPNAKIPWCHHIPIRWDKEFIPIKLLLGAEQFTVKPLNASQVDLITQRQSEVKAAEEKFIALEGDKYKAEVTFRKRNRALIEAKKSNSDGNCEVCGFNFTKFYRGFSKYCLVAHHLNPIGNRETGSQTSIDDIALLCPNCHIAVHTEDPPMKLEKLKKRIKYV